MEPSTWTSVATVRLPGLSRLAIVTATRRSLPSEGSISRLTKPNIVMFGFIIGASLLLALWLVIRAQRSLDTTFMALAETKARMQRFISRGARANARDGSAGPTKHDAVVLMADLRNFSGYAEANSVENTAALVNSFVTIATQAVEAHGGDVDKFMGDGLLAWFEGEDPENRAVQASIACIEGCAQLPRQPGIGLYRGEVISAVFGDGDRADFTILGRAVNLASRLCSLAGENEIAVRTGFSSIETLGLSATLPVTMTLKNHVEPVRVIRYSMRGANVLRS